MTTKQGNLKKLQQENQAFRDELNKLIPNKNRKEAWELINWIVENELQQEELCNER
jgi:hypothetical protein